VAGRNAKRLADLLQTHEARVGSLMPAEVVALRLYTGPMYVRYNTVLRAMGSSSHGRVFYSATIHIICSGLLKLSRVTPPPPGLIVYRGTGGMALGANFLEPDEQGCIGGVEGGLMSTSPDRAVALGNTGVLKGKDLPTLFEIEVGKTSVGANISMFSQFEAELEFLYPPLTQLEIVDTPRVISYEGRELSVLRLRLTVNQKTQTIEQTNRARRDFIEQLAASMQWRVRHWAREHELLERLQAPIQELQGKMQAEIDAVPPTTLNTNDRFAEMFDTIFDAADEESIKLAELVWRDGVQKQMAGQQEEARELFKKAIEARDGSGRTGICQDRAAGRARVTEMKAHVVGMQGGEGLGRSEQLKLAEDKVALADSLREGGEFEEAIAMYEAALAVFVALHGHEHPLVTATHSNIGIVYRRQGRYEEALVQYGKALEIETKVLGSNHTQVATTHNNMGVVYECQGKYSEALEVYSKALDIRVSALGRDHLNVASTHNNMGNVYRAQGKYEAALEAFSKSLDIKIKVAGQDSPLVADTVMNIGVVYEKLGRYEEALVQCGKAQEVYVAVYGDMHPLVADTKFNIGVVHWKMRDWGNVVSCFESAYQVRLATFGQEHPQTKDTLKWLNSAKIQLP